MSAIVPTITATDTHTYREQVERITPFAPRLHIDFADGTLAPTNLVEVAQAWLPENKIVDLHLMYQQPTKYLQTAVQLQPSLIIIHAEADNFNEALQIIRDYHIKCGLALLPQTPVEIVKEVLPTVDHVLIFGGHLGYQGGEANLELLSKVAEIRQLALQAEIGWDGGVNDTNAAQLLTGGIDVLNVGGFIQHNAEPADAYAKLLALAEA